MEFYLRANNFVIKQIDSLNTQHIYLEKQLDSLKAASQPKQDELDRLAELRKIISAEETEIDRLTQGSKQLKGKVDSVLPLIMQPDHSGSKPKMLILSLSSL